MRGAGPIGRGALAAAGAVAAWAPVTALPAAAAPLPPAANPAAQPVVAIAPRHVVYGHAARMTGTLPGGAAAAGMPVALLERAVPGDGLYREVARVPAGRLGEFAFELRPGGSAYFAARTRAEPVMTSIGLLVRVRPAVSVSVAVSRGRHRRVARFRGRVQPDLAGTPVRLQRRRGTGAWTTIARARLSRTSRYAIRARVRDPGGAYRISVSATSSLDVGLSRELRLTRAR